MVINHITSLGLRVYGIQDNFGHLQSPYRQGRKRCATKCNRRLAWLGLLKLRPARPPLTGGQRLCVSCGWSPRSCVWLCVVWRSAALIVTSTAACSTPPWSPQCSLLLIFYNNKSTPVLNESAHLNLCDFVHIKGTSLFDSMRMSLWFYFWLRRQREQQIKL